MKIAISDYIENRNGSLGWVNSQGYFNESCNLPALYDAFNCKVYISTLCTDERNNLQLGVIDLNERISVDYLGRLVFDRL